MTWDDLGRLTAVKDAAGTVTLAAYTYDPLDRLRMIDYGAGVRTRFRYVGLTTSAAQLIDDAAGTVSRHIGTGWTGERLLDWTGSGSDIRIYGTNAHHDVTWLASSTGSVSQALRYDPWGNPRSTVPTGYSPFRFQGSLYDATTDLSWVVTRWYAPALGTFISEDSLLGEPADPPSRHLYAYGAGEPVGQWDPDGTCAVAIKSPNTIDIAIGAIGCVLEGAGKAVGVAGGTAIFILSLPFLVSGDTLPPKAQTQPIALRLPRIFPRQWCFAIGEGQIRVLLFARKRNCATMPTLPPLLAKMLPRKTKLYLNGVWMASQMILWKHLYDLGPERPPYITSIYYRMERIYARAYPGFLKTSLWGWGLRR